MRTQILIVVLGGMLPLVAIVSYFIGRLTGREDQLNNPGQSPGWVRSSRESRPMTERETELFGRTFDSMDEFFREVNRRTAD